MRCIRVLISKVIQMMSTLSFRPFSCNFVYLNLGTYLFTVVAFEVFVPLNSGSEVTLPTMLEYSN